MPPEDGAVSVKGLSLHYLRWAGPAGAPPLVLLHATGFIAALWKPYAEPLSRRFDVYAYDARGHGDSDKPVPRPTEGPPSGYEWTRFAEDLAGFVDALSLRDIVAIGHSSGGAAALYSAASRPDLFSRLVAIEPIIFPPEATEASFRRRDQLAEGARKRRAVWPGYDEMTEAYRGRPTFARWRGDILRIYVEEGTFVREDGQIELKCPGETEARIYEGRIAMDAWSVLPRVRCPVLVLRGEETDQYLSWGAEGVSQRVADGRLGTIEGGSHFSPMEKPEAVLEAITRFLDEGGSA
ncbi:MAG: alpha/beta hydrolase [Chloroflexi bacterium]|nr:alpha/beta hydrolase [Chloroflexota bacterium]